MPVLKRAVIDGKQVRVMAPARRTSKMQSTSLRQIRRIITNFMPLDESVIDHFRRNPELAKLDPDRRNKVIDDAISDWVQSMARLLALEIRLAAECGEESQFWPPDKKTA